MIWIGGRTAGSPWIMTRIMSIDYGCLYPEFVHGLNWWMASGLPLRYTEDTLTNASDSGNVQVLQWWIDSGLELKYDSRAVDRVCEFGQLKVLDGWKHSVLELDHTNTALRESEWNGYIKSILACSVASGLEIKVDNAELLIGFDEWP